MLLRNQVIDTIQKYGHQLIGVPGEGAAPTFTYSIGLTGTYGHELIMIGLRYEYAARILNDIAASLSSQQLDVPFDDFTNMPVMLKRCTKNLDALHANYVVQADLFYGREVNVLQVVMCDRAGNFPDHERYDHEYMGPRQPLFFDYANRT